MDNQRDGKGATAQFTPEGHLLFFKNGSIVVLGVCGMIHETCKTVGLPTRMASCSPEEL